MEDQSSVPDLKLKETEPASQDEKLLWEKELLGLYISGHPLDKFKEKMAQIKINIEQAKKLPDRSSIVTAGMIEEVKSIMTKKNEPMLFLKLSDYSNSIETVIFPRILELYKDIICEGNCVAVKGKISIRNGDTTIIIDEMKEISNQPRD